MYCPLLVKAVLFIVCLTSDSEQPTLLIYLRNRGVMVVVGKYLHFCSLWLTEKSPLNC